MESELFTINSLEDLEQLSEQVTWQYFEKLVAFIFEKNDFDVQQNVVLTKDKERRQFDVIAKNKNKTYLIECKRWKSRAGAESALRNAVGTHIERGQFYADQYPEESIVPVLVTPLKGMPEEHNEVFIVPLTSLNWFLND
jgi:hypothetical protein